jgi:hypothetical protein
LCETIMLFIICKLLDVRKYLIGRSFCVTDGCEYI